MLGLPVRVVPDAQVDEHHNAEEREMSDSDDEKHGTDSGSPAPVEDKWELWDRRFREWEERQREAGLVAKPEGAAKADTSPENPSSHSPAPISAESRAPQPGSEVARTEILAAQSIAEHAPGPDRPFEETDGTVRQNDEPPSPLADLVEVRCKVCFRLPAAVQTLVKRMRFEQGQSNAAIVVAVNPLIAKAGLDLQLSAKNLSDHFRKHGTTSQQLDYQYQAVARGAHDFRMPTSPAQLIEALRDVRNRGLHDQIEFLIESLSEMYQSDLLAITGMRFDVSSDFRARAVAMLMREAGAIVAAVEASKRLGDPEAMFQTLYAGLFTAHVAEARQTIGASLESLAGLAMRLSPPDRAQEVRREIKAVLDDLAKALIELDAKYRAHIDDVAA